MDELDKKGVDYSILDKVGEYYQKKDLLDLFTNVYDTSTG